ncbi:MAG: carbohydrate binding family 9 domain-containing protein [Armatimonadota bacterium]
MLWRYLAITVLTVLLVFPACCNADTPASSMIKAIMVDTPPTLDGVLDDACWQNLQEYTGFVDDSTMKLTDVQTTVKICHDKDNIYIAFHALHPDPSKLSALETKRNGSIGKDDNIRVHIDASHLHKTASFFAVSAIGTQAEVIEKTQATKVDWKGDWRSATKIVDDGYNVEMEIPFSLLIFDKNQDTFGVIFSRYHSDKQIATQWPDLNGTWDYKYAADWSGIEPARVRPKPVMMGYMLGTAGSNDDNKVSQGLDLRYPFSNDMSALVSIKPDFGNVEQSVEDVDFSYTERYLPDYRPFFQEGGLPIDSRIFYSNRITDFDLGARFSGRNGPHNFGLINARDFGDTNDTIFGYSRAFTERSGFQVGFGDHRTPGHHNLATGFNGNLGWLDGQRRHSLSSGFTISKTSDQLATPDRPGGQMRYINYSTSGGNGDISGYIDYGHVDSDFDGELGYTPDWGVYGKSFGLGRSKNFRDRNLKSTSISFNASEWDEIDGGVYAKNLSLSGSLRYINGTGISASISKSRFKEFHDRSQNLGYSWNSNKLNSGGGLSYSWGMKADGKRSYASVYQNLKIGEKLVAGLSLGREKIAEPSPYVGTRSLMIFTLNYDLDPERSIGGRIIQRSGKGNAYFVYRQQVRHGMDIYFIYGDPNAEETKNKFILKLVRPMW